MSRYKELKSQFDEGVSSRGSFKTKGTIKNKILNQLNDHAIIDFDFNSASFCSMYAQYLDELGIDHSVVEEIILIGNASRKTIRDVQALYPNAIINTVEKGYSELTYDDLFCKHTLVFINVYDTFKYKKAIRTNVCDEYETTAKRPDISKFAKLLTDTRFIYNVIIYNSDDIDMSWQMSDIINTSLKADTIIEGAHDNISVIANLYIDSLKWYEDNTPFLVPKIAFEENVFKPKGYLFYDRPLTDSQYISHLSHDLCGEFEPLEMMSLIRNLSPEDQKEYLQASPYEIASNFRIYKLMELHDSDPSLAEQIIQCYEKAAEDGITEAYNNIGVYYMQIGDYETSRSYYVKAYEAGSVKAPVNLLVLASSIENDETEISKWEAILSKDSSQVVLWNNALDYWHNEEYDKAISIFEQLSEQEDLFQACGKGLCQMALKNLIKLYFEGKPEAGIERDLFKVQQLLPKLDIDENKEVIAVLLANGVLTRRISIDDDKRNAYKIFSKLYDKSKFVSNHTYNMAVCYATNLGCKNNIDAGRRKAISICQDLLEKKENDNLHFLLGHLYRLSGESAKYIEELEKYKEGGFANQSNIMMALSSMDDKEKWYNKCNELMQKPGCFHCHEAFNYNEKDRICPKVLQELGDYFELKGDNDNAFSFYECASNYDYPNAFQSLGKIAADNKDWSKAEKLYKRALSLGRKYVLAPLLWTMICQGKKIDKELLHYAMLYESIQENSEVEYYIHLNLPTISRLKDEQYLWLKKSADNGYNPAILAYAQHLEENEEYGTAVGYLLKYDGKNSDVTNKINKLISLRDELAQEQALLRSQEYDDDDDSYEYYDDYQDNYSWEDSLMDALDGEPDAYWNID